MKPAASLLPVLLLMGLLALMIVPFGTLPRVSASAGDFTMSVSPSSFSLVQGGSSTATLTLTGQGGYQGNVTLSVAQTFDSLNVGVTPTPRVVEIFATHPSNTSTINISAASARPGNYTIWLEGFDGTIYHHVQITCQVTGQDFAISNTPSRLTFPVKQNNTLDTSVVVTSLGGFTGNVNLTISVGSYYPGATQLPFPSLTSKQVSVTPSTPASFPLGISINSSMIAAPYETQITGTAHTTTGVPRYGGFDIIIGPDFNMTTNVKDLIVHEGAMAVATLTLTSVDGFQGGVNMYAGTIGVNPPNPLIPIYPADALLSAGGTNVTHIVAQASSRTGLGTYSLWIEATADSGWTAEALPFNVTVEGPVTGPDFTIYASPVYLSGSIGSTVTSTVNMYAENGFTGPLSLFAAATRGSGLMSPASVSFAPHSNATSTLTVNLPGPDGEGGGYTPWWYVSGIYSVLVIASGPTGLAHGAWVNITSTPFSISTNPTQQQLKANSTGKYTITVTGIGNFNDTVRLSAGAPPPFGAELSNYLLNFSGAPSSLSANLTVSVPAGTAAGSYLVQVTGTYLRPVYVCSCAPKVALNYTIPVYVMIAASSVGGATILGLPVLMFYEIVGAVGAAVVVAGVYLVIRWRKTVPRLPSKPSQETKL